MADLKSLREQRGRLVEESRALLSAAEAEKRELNGEEVAKFDELHDEIEKLGADIRREERQRDLEAQMTAAAAEREERAGSEARETAAKDKPDIMAGFRSWMQEGRYAFGEHVAEFRALSQGVSTEGGYLVAPQQFVASLIEEIDDAVVMRGLSTIYQLSGAHSMGVPTRDSDVSDADWTTELQTGSEDSSLAFGKREMRPHPVAKRIKVSKTLMSNGALPIENIVRARMSYKFGVTLEKAYLNGDGNQKPLGVFTASADGIPTSRDVATGNTATEIKADNLIETKYALKGPYQSRAVWLMHRDTVKRVAKLKDGDGQYLWRMSLRDGEPDTILGRPVIQSEFAPNTYTTGEYVGLFGDFANYWIVDSMQMQMQRLEELYAETNQVGFIGRYEGDGAPVLAEAFARMALA